MISTTPYFFDAPFPGTVFDDPLLDGYVVIPKQEDNPDDFIYVRKEEIDFNYQEVNAQELASLKMRERRNQQLLNVVIYGGSLVKTIVDVSLAPSKIERVYRATQGMGVPSVIAIEGLLGVENPIASNVAYYSLLGTSLVLDPAGTALIWSATKVAKTVGEKLYDRWMGEQSTPSGKHLASIASRTAVSLSIAGQHELHKGFADINHSIADIISHLDIPSE